ncbi:MAG: hypothetical protein OXJ52_04835 [Oligoflexia bacterium]|nr:hypothetical protein [Oligoflexia bacterium]
MRRVIEPALILLALFFSFSVLSGGAPSGYQNPFYKKKYIFHFSPPTGELQLYEILSAHQMDDYLLFDVDKMESNNFTYGDDTKCFFKGIVPIEDLERIKAHSKVVFSIQAIDGYNLAEPGDPVAPLPAPLPFYEGPGDPVAPLPAPLPFYEGPGDPVAPLPAPLPFYIDSDTGEYVILHKNHKGIVQEVIFLTPKREEEWSNDIANVWKEYFHRLEKTCNN